MGEYVINVIATSNATSNTEDVFIEIQAASGKQFKLKRWAIFYRGDANAPATNTVEARLLKVVSGTGGSGTSATFQPTDPLMPTAVSTGTVKNGSTALALGGTPTVLDIASVNEYGFYDWATNDPAEYWASGASGFMEIVLKDSQAARQFSVKAVVVE